MTRLNNTCAIVVTYHPDNKLYALLQCLLAQADAVLVVDNTENSTGSLVDDIERYLPQGNLKKIIIGHNLGIGAALNRGISWAKEQGFRYVLLSDQDSLPTANMVEELLNKHRMLTTVGHKIAVVGPQCVDKRTNSAMPFIRFAGCKRNRGIEINMDMNCQIVDFLITSGSLININIFESVGLFDENLFIDNVDIEWCLRAVQKGHVCVGIASATLAHQLGEKVVKLFGRSVHTHKPLRLYYRFRNSLLLYKRNYVPFCWKLRDGALLFAKLLFYSVFGPNRRKSITMMLLGLWHGVLGMSGKYAC